METIYMPRVNHHNVTDILSFKKYFNEFNSTLETLFLKNKRKSMKLFLEDQGIEETEQQNLKTKFNVNNYCWKSVQSSEKLVLPIAGFKTEFKLYNIPDDADLKSVQVLRSRQVKDEGKRRKLLRYTGEVNCENHMVAYEEDKYKDKIKEYTDYLLSVRVYLPTVHCSFSNARRTKPLQVSQEFFVYSKQTLDCLRDRILCSEDFNSAEGDISNNPFKTTTIRNMDVYRSGMFFINDKFFVDSRYPGNIDYSDIVKKWAAGKKLDLNVTLSMESSTFNMIDLRLGYPYLYMHQGNCEHLIVFTDARLITPKDILVKSAYPVMRSYASLRGKQCMTCTKKASKFIVLNTERLPLSRTYVCGLCLYQYFYIGDQKTDDFIVYKYLDRVALL
ncbi:unnamed protein product [Nezara viridula]|uniref:snRNA-activating protein complex subunit 3 n=1 Tax=Nezara viridula TaxID=85310 RepID=A0A9P0MSK9_NEZVI|nr:unnamed protein product [Nezara viridula]